MFSDEARTARELPGKCGSGARALGIGAYGESAGRGELTAVSHAFNGGGVYASGGVTGAAGTPLLDMADAEGTAGTGAGAAVAAMTGGGAEAGNAAISLVATLRFSARSLNCKRSESAPAPGL